MSTVTPQVTLTRAQIGPRRPPGSCAACVDTTAKSAPDLAQPYAPPWDLVCGHKNWALIQQGKPPRFPGREPLDDAGYTRLYEAQLALVGKETWRALYQHGREQGGRLVLLCYCPEDVFCHTHLLIAYACRRWPKAFAAEVACDA